MIFLQGIGVFVRQETSELRTKAFIHIGIDAFIDFYPDKIILVTTLATN